MSDAAPSTDADSKAVNVVIKGTVQDVFYRKWTADAAQKLGLNGWVRNLQDGSVEAVFSGPSSAVDDMIHQLPKFRPWMSPSGITKFLKDLRKDQHDFPFRNQFAESSRGFTNRSGREIHVGCFTSRLKTCWLLVQAMHGHIRSVRNL